MDLASIKQFLTVDGFYAISYAAEVFFAIWLVRVRSKIEKHSAQLDAVKEEDALKSTLLNEYQVRDRLQLEHITRLQGVVTKLNKELGYYKGKSGAPLGERKKRKDAAQ